MDGNFVVLHDKNAEKLRERFNSGRDHDSRNELITDVASQTIEHGYIYISFHERDGEPVLRFTDLDSFCEQRMPLKSFLEAEVAHFAAQINPEIDGDPVGYRFARYLLDGVNHFLREEASGNSPS